MKGDPKLDQLETRCTTTWARLCRCCTPTDILLLGTFATHALAYWGTGLPFVIIEQCWPSLIAHCKIQPSIKVPRRQLHSLLRHSVRSQISLLMGFVVLRKLKLAFVDRLAKRMVVDAPLPTARRICSELIVNMLMQELTFYTTHRLLHTGRLYKLIHKKHHEFKAPISLVSEYASNAEHIMGNILPSVSGPALLQLFDGHLLGVWAWTVWGMIMTNFHHCGYHFWWYPFRECTLMHDYHHHSFYAQLGLFGWMDKLFGTDGGIEYTRWRQEVVRRVGAVLA